jgi:roadblock/LC7 domain-containing protein
MATLDEMLNMEGVVMVGEFSPDGRLVEFRAGQEAPQAMGELSAQYIATVTMLFNTLGGAFTQVSGGMPWAPAQGWAYSGGEFTVASANNHWIFVETAKADFNQLFQVLIGPR